MLGLDQAIKNRGTAANLTATLPGGLWDHQVPEATWTSAGQPLYCSFENVSDAKFIRTRISRYQRTQVQFTVWGTDKVSVGNACEVVETAFNNSDRAASNPLALTFPDGIVSCILTTPYTITQQSDTVWFGSQTFTITYRRNSELNP